MLTLIAVRCFPCSELYFVRMDFEGSSHGPNAVQKFSSLEEEREGGIACRPFKYVRSKPSGIYKLSCGALVN